MPAVSRCALHAVHCKSHRQPRAVHSHPELLPARHRPRKHARSQRMDLLPQCRVPYLTNCFVTAPKWGDFWALAGTSTLKQKGHGQGREFVGVTTHNSQIVQLPYYAAYLPSMSRLFYRFVCLCRFGDGMYFVTQTSRKGDGTLTKQQLMYGTANPAARIQLMVQRQPLASGCTPM